ncbi:MAG: hypothetical protein AB7V32_01595, partial [Candidatus Berkiella sp.]
MAMLGASSAQDQEQDQLLTNLVYRYYSNEQLAPHLEQEKLALILKQIKAIRAFAQEYMPLVQISDEEITILSMSIFTPHQTPEKGIVDTDRNYIEVKRALSRFYCISLLQQGSEGYAAFVENQPKDNEFIPTLQKEEFAELAKKYQSLDALTLDTLKVATLISSVPLSLEAHKRADKIFGKNNYLVDTVEFAAKVFEDMDVARKVYPQVDYLLQRYPSDAQRALIKQNLQSAFAHHRHYRHMLYTEGSTNMFATLIAEVQQGKLSKEAYDFWVLYWNTNITGFQGNVQPKGSYYLTSNTHRAMCALESVLEALFDDNSLSASNLLSAYLTQRAGFLGLGDANNTGVKLNIKEQEFLAHIGAMMRFYNKEQGQLLSSSYLVIKDIIQDLRKDF